MVPLVVELLGDAESTKDTLCLQVQGRHKVIHKLLLSPHYLPEQLLRALRNSQVLLLSLFMPPGKPCSGAAQLLDPVPDHGRY